jgi:hypothetical protein
MFVLIRLRNCYDTAMLPDSAFGKGFPLGSLMCLRIYRNSRVTICYTPGQ